MTGAWEILDQQTATGRVKFGTTAWTDLITSSLRSALEVIHADGRTAYVFEVPCYGAGDSNETFPTAATRSASPRSTRSWSTWPTR